VQKWLLKGSLQERHASRQVPSWLIFDVRQKVKIRVSISAVCALLLTSLVGYAAEERPFFAIDGMPARFAIPVYERLSAKTVVMTEEVSASQVPIFASYGGDDRKEALDRIARALLEQASIELIPQKDGRILARVVVNKKA